MSVYVFTGPTISAAEASLELEAVYLPPAAEGDVYRVTLKRAEAIGIIDGYFQSMPSVRHKEILWAMSRGIHVFGSASMGALRAAELAAFGMEGVGTVFELYRDGILEDDDEVAIAHGPAEAGFLAGSEAMVNIRPTLLKAQHAGIISAELRTALERIGKELFYPDRNYTALLHSAAESGVPDAALAQLRQWLPEGRVNQKREDALMMLRLMRRRLAEGLGHKTTSYSFEHTSMWESARQQSGALRFDSKARPSVVAMESLLDEVRLEGNQYKEHGLLALERFFAIREAYRLGMSVTDRYRNQAESAFRRDRNLVDADQLERWLNDNDMSRSEFDSLMTDEARLSWLHHRAQYISISCLPEQLRLSGDYPRLRERASAKDRLLGVFGLQNPSLCSAGLTEDQLVHWYFKEIRGRSTPCDLNSYLRNLGFTSPDMFRRALLKEYLYRQLRHEDKHAVKLGDDRPS